MHEPNAHLSDWTLDLMAEDTLSHAERTQAEAHLRDCARCTGELAAARAVLASLASLPRFEPSATFADAVMARVVPLPQQAMAEARVRRWLPRTARGWMMMGTVSIAPMAALIGMLVWILTHPMVSAGAAFGMARHWVSETAWSAVARGAEALVRSGAWEWVADGVARLAAVSSTQAGAAGIALMVAIPASAWLMVRLLRTPMGANTHAY